MVCALHSGTDQGRRGAETQPYFANRSAQELVRTTVSASPRTPDSNLQEGSLQASRGPGAKFVPLPTHYEWRDSLPVRLQLIITYPLGACSLRVRLRVLGWRGNYTHPHRSYCVLDVFSGPGLGPLGEELLLVLRLSSAVTTPGDLRMCATLSRSY